jgi:hypothetical protein
MRTLVRGSIPWLLAGIAACATLPPALPEAAECRANFLGLDERIDAAEVRDGGAHRIPGFPYLRSDRFLASFRNEVDDDRGFRAWAERLRQLDLEARTAELRNLGWPDPREEILHLDRCGREWAARDLADPDRRTQLRKAAAVPDDYSMLARTLGFYPVAVPFLNLGIDDYNDEVREDYARPHAKLKSPGPLVLWRPAAVPTRADEFSEWLPSVKDPLGIPTLSDEDWQRLGAVNQPSWLIETGGEFDRPGAVAFKDGEPTVDTTVPVTYFLPAYTRFGDKVLAQLVYVVWFTERPKKGRIDSYAGTLDGVVWRVTLDEDGQPLLYDTIHPCGCYHYYYTAKPLQRKQQGGFWDEPVLFPQEPAPAPPFAIRIQSRTHYVRRLVPLDAIKAEKRLYARSDYSELLSLPDGKGGTRSLFCGDGLVCGSERFERFWLWPAGVRSAGAMRQWGRHATSFVGRSHFDDPRMMERLFEINGAGDD